MVDKDEFNHHVAKAIGTSSTQVIASYGVPEVLLNKGSIDYEFFEANRKLKADLREPYEIWLKRQAEEFDWNASASPDSFETEYFGKFESMEEYAVEEIEFLDRMEEGDLRIPHARIPGHNRPTITLATILTINIYTRRGEGADYQCFPLFFFIQHCIKYLDLVYSIV